jgi:tetratricopeptide (TPR) repeat protein
MSNFKNTVLVIFFLILTASDSFAKDQQMIEKFELANEYYNQAVYDSALILYHAVIDSGFASDALYYNTANAYFKLKDIPSSIVYYEKALKINPSDEDILHNLNIANSMITDKIEVIPQLFFRVWWSTFYTMLSADTWAWISVIVFIFTLIAAFIYLTAYNVFLRKVSFFLGLLLLFVSVGSFGLASQKYYYTQQTNEAIVFIPTITVKSSPTDSSVDLFVLHEGTKVTLLDHAGGWQKIRIANGSVGWLPEDVLKGI